MALVAALTGADFLLWNWSLGANNAVLAVIAGLTLPPLVAAATLMLVLSAARAISRIRAPATPAASRRSRPRPPGTIARPPLRQPQPQPATQPIRATRTRGTHPATEREPAPATAAAQGRPTRPARKLAA
jgi:hypothetical protein